MRKALLVSAALAASLAAASCSTPQDANAARGAVIGGTSGAVIGGLLSGRPAGALAGGAIGAASGAILGAASTPRPPPVLPGPPGPPCLRWGYDAYGEPVCLKIARY